jgi:hypothetical protein
MEVVERFGIFFIFAIVLVASPVIGRFMREGTNFFIELFGRIFGVL